MTSSPKSRYSKHVALKFDQDGKVLEFPGSTVICHVPTDSPTHAFLIRLRDCIKTQPWASKYSFLPPSSYHMTVFDVVCDQFRTPAHWTSRLPLDAPLEDVDRLLIEQWQNIDRPATFSVSCQRFYVRDVIGISLSPTSSEVEREMRNYRDILSQAFGVRYPNHAYYGFHITLAYHIKRLSQFDSLQAQCFVLQNRRSIQKEFGLLQFDSPELTFFADMTHFAHRRKDAIRHRQD